MLSVTAKENIIPAKKTMHSMLKESPVRGRPTHTRVTYSRRQLTDDITINIRHTRNWSKPHLLLYLHGPFVENWTLHVHKSHPDSYTTPVYLYHRLCSKHHLP